MIDSADEARFEENKTILTELLGEKLLKAVPLLIFANKQDEELACDTEEIVENLSVNEIAAGRKWNVQACSAMPNEDANGAKCFNGLNEGLEWLI